jgi:hypothetical protein
MVRCLAVMTAGRAETWGQTATCLCAHDPVIRWDRDAQRARIDPLRNWQRSTRAPAGLPLLSGFTALVYETQWVKPLGRVVGVEVHAVTIARSAFFAGLAPPRTPRRPLRPSRPPLRGPQGRRGRPRLAVDPGPGARGRSHRHPSRGRWAPRLGAALRPPGPAVLPDGRNAARAPAGPASRRRANVPALRGASGATAATGPTRPGCLEDGIR